MYVFFDTEFTGLYKDTSLISIGCASEKGDTFYAELTTYKKSQVDEWLQNNVITHLKFKEQLETGTNTTISRPFENMEVVGNRVYVSDKLKLWLASQTNHLNNEVIQFVSDVCHYDMVLLIDLLSGTALNLPDYIPPTCRDINQDIADVTGIDEKSAFNITREQFCKWNGDTDKHNALYDALVIKKCWEVIEQKRRENLIRSRVFT